MGATAVTEEETDQDPVTAEIAEIVGPVTDQIPGTESLQDVIEAHPMTEEDLDPRAEADLANLFQEEKNQLVFEILIQLFCFLFLALFFNALNTQKSCIVQ